jgi:HEAT repeat protein
MFMMRHVLISACFAIAWAGNSYGQAPDKIQGKTATEWIETLRTHKELKFRRVALIVLEVYGPRTDGVLPAVTGALAGDADPQVRREAAMLLGRMGDDAKGSIFALGDALAKDSSELVREAAAQSLGGKLNKFAAERVGTLAEALNDSHAGTRTAAAEAILKLGDKAEPALPNLMALAKDPKKDRFSRQYAVKCLGRLGSDNRDVAQILIDVMRDKTGPLAVREEAADGLGRSTVAAEVVLPPMAEMLTDPAIELRRAVAAALARQGKDAAIVWPKIVEGLKSPDQAIRYQLIRLCGHLHKTQPEALDVLIDSAKKDGNLENRLAAIQELGQISPPPVGDIAVALEEIAQNDANAAIRAAAEAALKKLSGI